MDKRTILSFVVSFGVLLIYIGYNCSMARPVYLELPDPPRGATHFVKHYLYKGIFGGWQSSPFHGCNAIKPIPLDRTFKIMEGGHKTITFQITFYFIGDGYRTTFDPEIYSWDLNERGGIKQCYIPS